MAAIGQPPKQKREHVVASGSIPVKDDAQALREELAAYAHDAWSGWMRYLFSKCSDGDDGGLVIPSWAVSRWARQMSQDWRELPGTDIVSDLKEADKMLSIVNRRAAAKRQQEG